MFARVPNILGRATALTAVEWLFFATAVKELALARLRHAYCPLSKLILQLQSGSASDVAKPYGRDTIERIKRLSWAIAAAASVVPWRSDCLLKVIAADRWLRRLGASPDFYLGVTKDEGGVLEAHAWLQCGDLTVTGGSNTEFTTLIMPCRASNPLK